MDESTMKPVLVTVGLEVYLRHRDDSLFCQTVVPIHPHVVQTEGVAGVMETVARYIVDEMADSNKMTMTDERFNVRIFLTNEIQSISVLAPDIIPEVLETEDEE